jgi:hypothetical protein
VSDGDGEASTIRSPRATKAVEPLEDEEEYNGFTLMFVLALIYYLNSNCTVPLEKLTVSQAVTKLPEFYETRKFI